MLRQNKAIMVLFVLIIMFTNICFASEKKGRNMNAFEYLSRSMEEHSNDSITRSDCVSCIMRLIGMSEEDAYDAVYNTCYDEPIFDEFGRGINDGYIVEAYGADIAKGVNEYEFAPERAVTLKECLTFMLRCLTDSELVEWENAMQDSVKFGLLSEEELMIYDEKLLLNRNMFYTAVTRAKKKVILVGSDHVIKRMVDNNTEAKRYTGLKDRLMEISERL